VDVVEQAVQVEGEEQEPGTTVVLTAEGWEATAYVKPEEDWVVREDGSLESPDGTMRTWMPADPAGG
jgi:hypothetical protein